VDRYVCSQVVYFTADVVNIRIVLQRDATQSDAEHGYATARRLSVCLHVRP